MNDEILTIDGIVEILREDAGDLLLNEKIDEDQYDRVVDAIETIDDVMN